MDVAGHIRNFREEAGMSQKELAELAGLSYSFINDVENERRTPSIERLRDRVREIEGRE